MDVIIFEKEAYYKMLSEVMRMFQQTVKDAHTAALQTANGQNDWIEDEDAKKLLGIRSKTRLQQLRDANAIVFTKFGRKIKYSRKSIVKFLDKNIQSF